MLNPSATSAGGAKYLLVIVDQFTGFIEVYAQKHIHPETSETSLPHFLQVCNNSFGVTVGTLRADLGPEFVTKALAKVCKENGIRQEFSATSTPMHR